MQELVGTILLLKNGKVELMPFEDAVRLGAWLYCGESEIYEVDLDIAEAYDGQRVEVTGEIICGDNFDHLSIETIRKANSNEQ